MVQLSYRIKGGLFVILLVKRRIYCVEIFIVHLVCSKAEAFAEALEMHDFTFTQELDNVTHIGVINKTENVVVCCASSTYNKHLEGRCEQHN